jgi:hypothetical protein
MSDLLQAAEQYGGTRSARRREGVVFPSISAALALASDLGFAIDHPGLSDNRRAEVFVHKRLIVMQLRRLLDEGDIDGWHAEPRYYERVLGQVTPDAKPDYSDTIRAVGYGGHGAMLTPDGFRVLIGDRWTRKDPSAVRRILQSFGHSGAEADRIMGGLYLNEWEIVRRPFKPEYPLPGQHVWNLGAPQLRHPEPRPGHHPYWSMILNHIGREMDGVLPGNEWAKANGIVTGGQWLTTFLASVFRFPERSTPYLFLHGPENSGKSIFHEAVDLLVTSGVVFADRALTSQSDFNGELEHAIFCIVEEKNLARSSGALNKIKAAVTSPRLSIRRMRMDSYMIENLTHWLQCSNESGACFVSHADTRIQPLFVDLPERDIPKGELIELLKAEAEAFTATLLSVNLPEPKGRLALEIVDTASRLRLADEAVPEYIHAIVTLGEFRGSASDLAQALGPGEWPKDFRLASGMIDANRAYLRKAGIDVTYTEKTKKGRLICLASAG